MDWLNKAIKCAENGKAAVLVTVAEVSGSGPRDMGAKMLVMADDCISTIGGGALEQDAIKMARDTIKDIGNPALKDYPLGPSLGQCCGGFMRLTFEPIDKSSLKWLNAWKQAMTDETPSIFITSIGTNDAKKIITNADDNHELGLIADGENTLLVERVCDEREALWIFGAGHVGTAVAKTLAPLDFNITMVDSRAEFLNGLTPDISAIHNDKPELEVANMPAKAMALIMTQSHEQDFEICYKAILRGDLSFIGLIGSGTKKARFIKRLHDKGLNDKQIDSLTCPIGIEGIRDKKPAAIAISVAAQLLSLNNKKAIQDNNLDNISIAN